MPSSDKQAHARFYGLLNRLSALPGQGLRLADYSRSGLAERGVYFFFEPGEHRHGDSCEQRVVRVGTHALGSGSKSRLWGRLRAHRGAISGSGNHRSSVFRLNVGEAILVRDKRELPTWGVKSGATKEVRLKEAPHELAVSRYIGTMRSPRQKSCSANYPAVGTAPLAVPDRTACSAPGATPCARRAVAPYHATRPSRIATEAHAVPRHRECSCRGSYQPRTDTMPPEPTAR